MNLGFGALGGRPLPGSNFNAWHVFERRGHLHPLIALHIVTKFLA